MRQVVQCPSEKAKSERCMEWFITSVFDQNRPFGNIIVLDLNMRLACP
jgi:hypothetical protein